MDKLLPNTVEHATVQALEAMQEQLRMLRMRVTALVTVSVCLGSGVLFLLWRNQSRERPRSDIDCPAAPSPTLTSIEPEPEILYEETTGAATDEGVNFEKRISTLVFLRGLSLGHEFYLGLNVANVHPFDDVFYLYKKDNEWVAVLCQLKHCNVQKVLKGNDILSLNLNNKQHFNLIRYGSLSFENKKKIDGFLATALKQNSSDKTPIKKYVLYTTASIHNNCLGMMENGHEGVDDEWLRQMDRLFKTGKEAYCFPSVRYLFFDKLNEILNGNNQRCNKNSQTQSNELANICDENDHNSNITGQLQSKKSSAVEWMNGLFAWILGRNNRNNTNDRMRSKELHPDFNKGPCKTFFDHVYFYTEQLRVDELPVIIEKALKEALMIRSKDVLDGDSLAYFRSQVECGLDERWNKNKTNGKLKLVTNKVDFWSIIQNTCNALLKSREKINKWCVNKPVSLKLVDRICEDLKTIIWEKRITYVVNQHGSVKWSIIKLTGCYSNFHSTIVHDLTYLIENTDSVISTLKLPNSKFLVIKSEEDIKICKKKQSEISAKIGKLLQDPVYKDRSIIIVASKDRRGDKNLAYALRNRLSLGHM